jgi:hypothetical protein
MANGEEGEQRAASGERKKTANGEWKKMANSE